MGESGAVIIEFFGVPRLRAGCAELLVPLGTVGETLARVEHACPGLRGLVQADGRLAPHYLLSVNGCQFVSDVSRVLQPGDRLLLLSADAGG